MPVSSPIPPPGGPDWPQAIAFELMTDSLAEALERRVTALEHALCSRPARRTLRRHIRHADRAFAWAGPGFWDRRLEATANEWLNRQPATGPARPRTHP
jgi:hypothetical protein